MIVQKIKSKINSDEYYTMEGWPTKNIDGKEFLYVVKNDPVKCDRQSKFWILKENTEIVGK